MIPRPDPVEAFESELIDARYSYRIVGGEAIHRHFEYAGLGAGPIRTGLEGFLASPAEPLLARFDDLRRSLGNPKR